MKTELKDWQIAQMMFGKNTKHECKIVSGLRKYGTIEHLCDGWSIIYDNGFCPFEGSNKNCLYNGSCVNKQVIE